MVVLPRVIYMARRKMCVSLRNILAAGERETIAWKLLNSRLRRKQ
jgi:hypothetical protein